MLRRPITQSISTNQTRLVAYDGGPELRSAHRRRLGHPDALVRVEHRGDRAAVIRHAENVLRLDPGGAVQSLDEA